MPCHLMGFLDFTCLPNNESFSYKGSVVSSPGYYAIVEYALHIADDEGVRNTEIFTYVEKQFGLDEELRRPYNLHYLVDCDSIVSPLAVIPDFGGKPNGYFTVKERQCWGSDFATWLSEPHEDDEIREEELAPDSSGLEEEEGSDDDQSSEE